MSKIILNANAKMRVGGRKAPKMSEEDFFSLLKKKVFPLCMDYHCESEDEIDSFYLYNGLLDVPAFYKDIRTVQVDCENCDGDCEGIADGKGIHMTSTGIPYLMLEPCGDWEVPVLLMVYWDGKSFRGYYPHAGNTFNALTKEAIGNDEDKDAEFLEMEGYDGDVDTDDIVPDYDLCKKDFEMRVEAF